MRGLFPAILLVTLPLLAGCAPAPSASPAPVPVTVKVLTLEKKAWRETVEGYGIIEYYRKADIYPSTQALLRELYKAEGETVQKGEVFGKLDEKRLLLRRKELQAALRADQAKLDKAREELKIRRREVEARLIALEGEKNNLTALKRDQEEARLAWQDHKKLQQLGGVSRKAVKSHQNRYLTACNNLAQARARLRIKALGFRDGDIRAAGHRLPEKASERLRILQEIHTAGIRAAVRAAAAERDRRRCEEEALEQLLASTELTAPLSGVMGILHINSGELASPDKPVATIFALDPVYAVIPVPEDDYRRISQGAEAEVVVGNDIHRRGTVKVITPYIDPAAQTGRIRIVLENRDRILRPGMYAEARIETGVGGEALLLPESALSRKGQVQIVRKGRIFQRHVETEALKGSMKRVLSGLKEGEKICVYYNPRLKEGAAVKVSTQ